MNGLCFSTETRIVCYSPSSLCWQVHPGPAENHEQDLPLVSYNGFLSLLQKVISDKQLGNSISFKCLEEDCRHTAEKLPGRKRQ